MSKNTLYPNTFQHHNAYIDEVQFYLTGNEEKVLNRIIREIMGWEEKRQTLTAIISLSILVDGKISKKDGSRISFGCGLAEGTVRKILKTLCEFRLIERIGKPTRSGQIYKLQLNMEKFNWPAIKARKAKTANRHDEQIASARKLNPLLLNRTPSVEQNLTPSVEQNPTPSVEQKTKNSSKPKEKPTALSSEKSSEPSALDDYLGPRPPAEPLVVGRWQDKHREWSHAGGDNIRARNGISENSLRRTHWLLTEAGKAAPRSTAGWKVWRSMLAAVYEEAAGNFATIDAIAGEIVKRGKWAGKVGNWHNVAREVREQRVTILEQNLPRDSDFVPARDFFAPPKEAA